MKLVDFIALHAPALEANEARHNLILGLLERVKGDPSLDLMFWTLGGPGQCAIKTPRRGLLLGEPSQAQCRDFAIATAALEYPSVAGPDETAQWFVRHAEGQGLKFKAGMAQRIHALSAPPKRPNVPGAARRITLDDAGLLMEWSLAFNREAVPEDPVPSREDVERAARQGRHFLWMVDGQPVAMAAIGRHIRNCASIAPVYTPPEFRARGFGGAVTAAVVDQIFAEGHKTACLYTDLSNPSSNRCYAKLGFTPVCDAWVFTRQHYGTGQQS